MPYSVVRSIYIGIILTSLFWAAAHVAGVAAPPAGVAAQPAAALATPAAAPTPAAVLTFAADEDAYVAQSAPAANYGASRVLRVDANPIARTYLRFQVDGVRGHPLRSAVLRLYAESRSTTGISVYRLEAGDWHEDNLTYANAPAAGQLIRRTAPFNAGTWVSVDLTSYFADEDGDVVDGVYDLVLGSASSTNTTFAARETAMNETAPTSGSAAPQLVIRLATQPQAAAKTAPGPPGQAGPYAPTRLPIARSGDVLLLAGDICKPVAFGKTGEPTCQKTGAVVRQVLAANPDAQVQLLGDNVYDDGASPRYDGEFDTVYDPYWGSFLALTRAAMGNHDIFPEGDTSYYFDYFGAAAGPQPGGYYSYNNGQNWHVIVLNSNCAKVGGCEPGSPQYAWLEQDLAANTRTCLLAVWHHPRFTSGRHPDDPKTAAFWELLYQYQADIVASGHNHVYERFYLMDGQGRAAADGLRQFVVGTGGASGDSFSYSEQPLDPHQAVRNQRAVYGVLQLTLREAAYRWDFLAAEGSEFSDSGVTKCH